LKKLPRAQRPAPCCRCPRFSREEAQLLKKAIKATLFRAVQDGHGCLKFYGVAPEGRLDDELSLRRESNTLARRSLVVALRITRPFLSSRSTAAVIDPLASSTLA
jgi:hypothetical protein